MKEKVLIKRLPIILIFCMSYLAVSAQSDIEYTFTSIYKNDSLIEKRYLSDYCYDLNQVSYFYSFDSSGDTLDVLIIYEDKNGNDSLEIWIYPEHTDSIKYDYCNSGKLLKEITFDGEEKVYDTLYFLYNQNARLIRKLHSYDFGVTKDSLIYKHNVLIRKFHYSAFEFRLSESIHYYYNRRGKLVKIESFDNENRRTGLTKYRYNGIGLRVRSSYKHWYYSEFVKDFKSTHKVKYNNDKKVSKSVYIGKDKKVLTYNYYDLKQRIIKRVIIDKVTGIKTIKEREF